MIYAAKCAFCEVMIQKRVKGEPVQFPRGSPDALFHARVEALGVPRGSGDPGRPK